MMGYYQIKPIIFNEKKFIEYFNKYHKEWITEDIPKKYCKRNFDLIDEKLKKL